MNTKQLIRLTVETLKEYPELYSPSAVNLNVGTFAVESGGFQYIRQVPKGEFDINKHALGLGQIERSTFDWIKSVYADKYNLHNDKFEELEYNIKKMILYTRLRYRLVPEPLPRYNDAWGMANYWKKYYNTYKGAGTPLKFVKAYYKFILNTKFNNEGI